MSEKNGTLRTRPCVMIIRDGWGYNPRPEEDAYNSIKLAKPPVDAMTALPPSSSVLSTTFPTQASTVLQAAGGCKIDG